jgi:hypothetical protein
MLQFEKSHRKLGTNLVYFVWSVSGQFMFPTPVQVTSLFIGPGDHGEQYYHRVNKPALINTAQSPFTTLYLPRSHCVRETR